MVSPPAQPRGTYYQLQHVGISTQTVTLIQTLFKLDLTVAVRKRHEIQFISVIMLRLCQESCFTLKMTSSLQVVRRNGAAKQPSGRDVITQQGTSEVTGRKTGCTIKLKRNTGYTLSARVKTLLVWVSCVVPPPLTFKDMLRSEVML